MANNGAAIALLACVYDPLLSYSLTVHGPADFYDVHRLRLREKVERAKFVSCISNFCRSQVMLWSDPRVWDRIHVVHMGVDTKRSHPASARAHAELRMISVGRLAAIKGHLVLFEAAKALAGDGVAWTLDVVGDGSCKAALERKVDEIGLRPNVVFSGPISQENLSRHLDAANLMVLASFGEGVPVAFMEAMAMEIPVVATRVGGVSELVRHGETGFLVDAGSVEQLADLLRTVASDPTRRAVVARAGRTLVESEFNLEGQGRSMADLFRTYCGR
jgi:glycosyltransferase involved in cell wall biosynthesis